MWAELVQTPLFGIGLTLVVYLLAQTLYRRVNSVWANPVLVAIVAIILLLKGTGVEYRDYARGGDMILFLLGPSVVALARTSLPASGRDLETQATDPDRHLRRLPGLDHLSLRPGLDSRWQPGSDPFPGAEIGHHTDCHQYR